MPSRFEYERAVRASDLPPLSRLLAFAIATWADLKTGTIPHPLMPSLTTLESATGMSRGSVRAHLDRLESDGWLVRKRPSVAAARAEKARTQYRLRIPRSAVVLDTGDALAGGEADSASRAAPALEGPEKLGQESPQAGAGAALELGQEMTPARAGAALNSSFSATTANHQTAPVASGTPDGLAGGRQQHEDRLAAAAAFLEALPEPWTIGPVSARATAPDLIKMIDRQGWDLDADLVAKLTERPGGITSYPPVLRLRIKDLPRRVKKTPPRPAAPLPEWCGDCADGSRAAIRQGHLRLVYDDSGRARPCPKCHPTQASHAA